MTFRELLSLLDGPAPLPAVMLWHGEEEFLKEEALRGLRARLLPDGLEALNETILEGAFTPDALVAACETVPLMAERRLVIARDPALLCAPRPVEDDARRVSEYLPKVPAHAVLLFYVRGRVDGRRRLSQAAQQLGGSVHFQALNEHEASLWLEKRANAAGQPLPRGVADAMVYRAGVSLHTLAGELDKLLSHAAARGEAPSRADVHAVVTRSAQSSVFDMIDRLLEGRMEAAYRIERDLVLAGETRVGMLALVTRAVRISRDARALLDAGLGERDMAAALGLSRYAAQQAAQKALRRDAAWWKAALSGCVQAEEDIRQGAMREEFAFAITLERISR